MNNQKKIKNKTKEGFTSEYSEFDANSLSRDTKALLNISQILTNPSARGAFSEYDEEYNSALEKLEYVEGGDTDTINDYYARISPKNPYLNTNIRFLNGVIAYVTNQGVVKIYPDINIYQSTAGLNGCPSSKKETQLKLPWLFEYNFPNTTIPTNPPLITGTPMTQGQSCGYEGTNVYVNTVFGKKVQSTYQGCFADNASSPAMTYIGGAPPEPYSLAVAVENPNFDYPQLDENSYVYISNMGGANYDSGTGLPTYDIQVPGWTCVDVCLINNSTAWSFPMPYPYGNQAIVLQGNASLGLTVQMPTVGIYTLTLYAVGRPSPYSFNTINFGGGPGVDYTSTSDNGIMNFTPNQDYWDQFTCSLNITSTGSWYFWFIGADGGDSGNYSTAIQNISITVPAVTSGGGGGTYTSEMCKEYAMVNGYQYYAIQDANSSGVGYCAVSNNLIGATRYGESTTATSQQIAWESNTTGQIGNSAILNDSGSLVVINTTGTIIFATPNNSNLPPNYLGCYADNSSRTFSNAITNGQLVNATQTPYSFNSSTQSCQQAAQSNNMSYFGLQDSNIEGQSQCFVGNTNATQLGMATNCTQFSDGTFSGGAWSNAVYSTNPTPGNVNYFLSVLDSGLVGIYLGQNPNDNQSPIWSYQATVQDPNRAFAATYGISGQNWISNGTTLAPGDFVGSPNGYCALKMQTNGNLTIIVFVMGPNCATINGSEVGNFNANAIYGLSEKGNLSDVGQVAYIDQDSNLYPYDLSNVGFSNDYTNINGFDSSGNNLPNSPITNSSVDKCKSICDSNDDCYGFSIINGTCYPKNNQMYPNTQLTKNSSSTLYVRNQAPITPPFGVNATTNNINSSQYINYIQNGEIVSNSGASINGSGGQFNAINLIDNPNLYLANNEMSTYADGLNERLKIFNKSNIILQNQATRNVDGVKSGLKDIEKLKKKIKNFNLSSSNILDNSDITVLQQNYNYMFWSILAIGTVIVSMHISKF